MFPVFLLDKVPIRRGLSSSVARKSCQLPFTETSNPVHELPPWLTCKQAVAKQCLVLLGELRPGH